MPVRGIGSGLGVRWGGDRDVSQPYARGHQDCHCTYARESFHITNDTKLAFRAEVTIDVQVNNGARWNDGAAKVLRPRAFERVTHHRSRQPTDRAGSRLRRR